MLMVGWTVGRKGGVEGLDAQDPPQRGEGYQAHGRRPFPSKDAYWEK